MTATRWGRRVGITLVSVLAAAAVGVAGGVVTVRAGSATEPPITPTEAPTTPATTPADSVRRYLEALAADDADAALAEAATQPADRTLLTDEVLRASHAITPMTDVNVPAAAETSSVEASYRLGTELITRRFDVEEVPGGYRVSSVTTTIDIASLNRGELPMAVMGTAVDSDSLTLFPGVYAVTTTQQNLRYGVGEVAVKDPDQTIANAPLTIEMTDVGRATFADLIRDELRRCTKSTEPAPKDCPIEAGIPDSRTVVKGSGSWKVPEDGYLDDFAPRLDYEDPTVATAFVSGQYTYSYEYTSDTEDGPQEETATAYLSVTYRLDLDAEKLVLTAE